MRTLNSLYVRSHRAKIRHRRGVLMVEAPEGKQSIPLNGLDAVVLMGEGQFTSQALAACVQKGVRVASLRSGGGLRFVVTGPKSGNVHLRQALYAAAADADRSLALAKGTVAAKIKNSRKVLSRWRRDEQDASMRSELAMREDMLATRLEKVAAASTADQARGIEGDAARTYFRGLRFVLANTNMPFGGRNRRPPRDPANACLSFCYGLMLSEFIGALESVGLDHQLGFLHRPRSGRPSLALDLAEELRSLTDRFVVSLIRRRQMPQDSFTRMPGGGVYLSDAGRAMLIGHWERHKDMELPHRICGKDIARWALPAVQSTLLARHLRGDLPCYPPFILT